MTQRDEPVATRRPRRRLVLVAALTVVTATAWGASHRDASASVRPEPGFRCGPFLNYPTLKPGQTGSFSTTFDGYRATYTATRPVRSKDSYFSGMPFPGRLTVTHHSDHWTMSRPEGRHIGQLGGICVIRFAHASHPVVMVEGFSGGAHCCMVPVIYSYDRSHSTYAKVLDMSRARFTSAMKFDPNEGYVARTVGGAVVLETGDGVFPYYFGCYACTPAPVHLEALRGHALVDVTAPHPAFVGADARQLWRSVVSEENGAHRYYGLFGSLAAWTAEECTIGRGTSAWTRVQRLARRGVLRDQNYYRGTFATTGSFVPTLRAFLLRNGYCRGQLP